jgi:tetratricopeptide (TPR) repeat protein
MKSVLFLGLTFALVGCSVTPVNHEVTQVSTTQTGLRIAPVPVGAQYETVDYNAYQYYVNGLLFEGEGDLPRAADSYARAWKFEPESVEIGLAYANALAQMRKYSLAVAALAKISKRTSEVLSLEGLCYRRLGETETARDTYLELVTLDSSNSMSYMFLASYYQQRQVQDSVIWALQNLARVLPNNHDVLNELAKAYVAAGQLREARQTYLRSLQMTPAGRNAEALMNLVDLYPQDQKFDSALFLFNAALEKEPDNALLHQELARMYLERDSVRQALPHMWSAARLIPDDFLLQRRLAIVLIAVDSLVCADSILTALVGAGDPDPATRFYLGRAAILEHDYERAKGEMLEVTRGAASLPDGWLALGFIYRQLGQPEREIDTYRDALNHMQEEQAGVQLYFALGAAFEQAGMVDSAVAAFEEILEHNPDHAPSLNYLGYTLADRGTHLDYARELIARAVELQPNNPAYLDSYGWVYYRLGDYQEAVKYLEAAAELDSDPVIYDHLGDALHAIGETDRAREWWQKALEQQPNNETIQAKLNK